MRALVLFKGTGSVDRSLEALIHGHVPGDTLDLDPDSHATWTANVLDWEDWREIPPESYDFVWASPPCTQNFLARATAKTPRDFERADRIAAKTLEIIHHLMPKGWLMENPATGLLKTRDVVAGMPFRDVCYCMYSDRLRHTYKKPARLWGD